MKSKPVCIQMRPYSGRNKTIVKNTMQHLCGQDIRMLYFFPPILHIHTTAIVSLEISLSEFISLIVTGLPASSAKKR